MSLLRKLDDYTTTTTRWNERGVTFLRWLEYSDKERIIPLSGLVFRRKKEGGEGGLSVIPFYWLNKSHVLFRWWMAESNASAAVDLNTFHLAWVVHKWRHFLKENLIFFWLTSMNGLWTFLYQRYHLGPEITILFLHSIVLLG